MKIGEGSEPGIIRYKVPVGTLVKGQWNEVAVKTSPADGAVGFRREAHLIENDRFNGVWGDEYIYALLEREWFGLTVAEAASPITAET